MEYVPSTTGEEEHSESKTLGNLGMSDQEDAFEAVHTQLPSHESTTHHSVLMNGDRSSPYPRETVQEGDPAMSTAGIPDEIPTTREEEHSESTEGILGKLEQEDAFEAVHTQPPSHESTTHHSVLINGDHSSPYPRETVSTAGIPDEIPANLNDTHLTEGSDLLDKTNAKIKSPVVSMDSVWSRINRVI